MRTIGGIYRLDLALAVAALALGASVCGQAGPDRRLASLPLTFEPNLGQAREPARFLSRAPAYTFFLAPDEAVIAPRGGVAGELRMRFLGARPDAIVEAQRGEIEAQQGEIETLKLHLSAVEAMIAKLAPVRLESGR